MRHLRLALILLLSPGCAAPPQTEPLAAGVDAARIAALRTEFQGYVDRHQTSGTVTLVARKGKLLSLEAVGWQDMEARIPMKPDSIFQIASMTKPVTAMGVLMLEEEGKLSIEDPVEKHLPEFRGQQLIVRKEGATITLGRPGRPITVKDLLTHTSGLRGGSPPGFGDLYAKRNRTLAEATIAISQWPLEFEPGSKWAYCNAGIDTLGRIIEVCSGRSYESFLEERLFQPLGMKDTFFYPTEAQRARVATLYKKDKDSLARAENFLGDAVGGRFPLPAGGMFSTAPDLMKLYQMMLDRGTAGGRRYLSEASIAKMTQNHTGDLRAGFTDGVQMGLGWQLVGTPTGVTEMLSPGTYGHGGAFGTQGWIDPRREMIFILMVQRSGFPNGDASDLRKSLQAISVSAIKE
ncbi:MAG TPA: serine hydrolase domain-containing protein [Planctomycetota bacterium]|nr:serine hydrolase domain-containing protein [Planctomycetota bacterium]